MASLFDKESRVRGAVFLDLVFATLPILLIVVYTLTSAAYLSETSVRSLEEQVVFHKLVSVSDTVVKQLASEKSGGGWDAKSEPNLISAEGVAAIDAGALNDKIGLKSISIFLSDTSATTGGIKNQFTSPPANNSNKNCIYRLVVVGESLEIKKLSVCGT